MKRPLRTAIALGCASVLLLASCGSSDDDSEAEPSESAGPKTATLAITAKDFSYEMPTTAKAGLTTVTLTNSGEEDHQAQIALLNSGVTYDQLTQALQQPDPSAALGLVTLFGGPNTIPKGETQSVIANLAPGSYVVLCFVSGSDNVPHLAKGMISQFTVTGEASTAEVPAGEGTITASDFTFMMPQDFSGKGEFLFTNNGPQPHELTILKLAPGKTTADLENYLGAAAGATPPTGPPPIVSSGGAVALNKGGANTVELNLGKGSYVFTCFVPDPATGKPHAELGMIEGVEVA